MNLYRTIEKTDKYALTKRFRYDLQLQVSMYSLMHVDPETMVKEDYFTDTFFWKLQENVNPRTSPKTLDWIQLHKFIRL